jgi:hypothetical protein
MSDELKMGIFTVTQSSTKIFTVTNVAKVFTVTLVPEEEGD